MTQPEIARLRLAHQQVSRHDFAGLAETVAHLGALQAQDYAAGLWSLGLRHPGLTEAAAQQALDDRTLVCNWSLRGTLHLMAAQNARWITALCGPRVIATCAGMHRKLGLDTKQFAASAETLARNMEGSHQGTRKVLASLAPTDLQICSTGVISSR